MQAGPKLEPTIVGVKGRRGLIPRVLAPALKLWLRSQLEDITDLQLQIDCGDRQFLSGYIPQVRLAAEKAIYQGVHLSSINLRGQDIRVNVGQVLKGQPLRLLNPIPIDLAATLQQTDFQQSLASVLLQTALIDALQVLMGPQISAALGTALSDDATAASGEWTLVKPELCLDANQLTFSTILTSTTGQSLPLTLQTRLKVGQPWELVLHQLQWCPSVTSETEHPFQTLPDYTFNLGEHVNLEELRVIGEEIVCRGQLLVMP